ncbi:MAG TPA: GDP-mannose 4,6-dehydratase [Thermoflexales bacterium]|jgi:GDP-4-dehydro-6-deoxy-D-mannose reductase|nr:GDP-mannose 4,6-dehydratase [Thermoflexales bacterium]HQX11546.1 GDP-mannose 4,6-dehydratase [Thermoflexales bacterium]HQY25868.1 GDP-mannose 4,6-dehydratase [Thermoflexales bacterium]HQZ54554.1 GDP-mannose 4,6-dehydratase [Thermoflexales bacterium]HRA54443.1 GDP-mannose 4,6-dehydratase [Thermoflexales bacterium]
MRVLITGMNGFAGSHLADLLIAETHWLLIGASRNASGERTSPRMSWWNLDLRDADAVKRLIKLERPDLVIHLAAQPYVPAAWDDPWATFEMNVRPQQNLFDALLASRLTPRILIASSVEVYGPPSDTGDLPFRETRPTMPVNPYGVSKVAQEAMALQYRRSHGLDVVVARPFNHIGPRQTMSSAANQFAQQIAEIEAGLREPVLRVGNMTAQRDFSDVRDVARAYLGLIRLGEPGEIYNICSGQPRSVQALLDILLSKSHKTIAIEPDPARIRPADTLISYGSNEKLSAVTGWAPRIPFEQTVSDILDDWRERVRTAPAPMSS